MCGKAFPRYIQIVGGDYGYSRSDWHLGLRHNCSISCGAFFPATIGGKHRLKGNPFRCDWIRCILTAMKVPLIARLESLRSVPERIFEAADKPLLALAVVGVWLYLLELHGFVAPSGAARTISFSLDALFVADFLLKVLFLRGRCLHSAWIATDPLEPASAQCGTQALFCDESCRLCGEMPGIAWQRRRTVRVKGKAEPQVVWEAMDISRIPDLSFLEAYQRARAVFESEGPATAWPLFATVNDARPGGDPPSQVHMKWNEELARGDRAEAPDTAPSVTK